MPDRSQLGLYISVPFCAYKCTWCNFSSGVHARGLHEPYIATVITHLRQARAQAAALDAELPQTVDTIYLGGGTPSLLAPHLIQQLFTAIRSEFSVLPDAEITVECAPGQLSPETLTALTASGVNRASFGVQSFVDEELRASGRQHSGREIFNDLLRLRHAGVENISLDLIAGLAHQTRSTWNTSLDLLAETRVPHASVYMMEIDEGSRLGRELINGGTNYHAHAVPSDELSADFYQEACARLPHFALNQYEISNFAAPGMESRHNGRYWTRRPYLGLGLDASSMLYRQNSPNTLRWKTTDELSQFMAPKQENEILELTHQTSATRLEEAWFLGLRLNTGVQFGEIEQEFGGDQARVFLPLVQQLAEEGLLLFDGQTTRLTERGRMLSNDVFASFLGLNTDAADAGSLANSRS